MDEKLCAICNRAPRNPLANVCKSCSDKVEQTREQLISERQITHPCLNCEAAARELADAADEIARLRTLKDAEPGQWNAALELADLRARFLAAIDELRGMADVMRQHQMLPNTSAAIDERVAELTGNDFQPDDLRARIEAEAYAWRQRAAILLDRGNPMALGLEQAAQRLLFLIAEKEAK